MLKVSFGGFTIEKLQVWQTPVVNWSQKRVLELFKAPIGSLLKKRSLNFERDVSLTSLGVRLVTFSARLVCLRTNRLSVQLLLELIANLRDPSRITA